MRGFFDLSEQLHAPVGDAFIKLGQNSLAQNAFSLQSLPTHTSTLGEANVTARSYDCFKIDALSGDV